MNDLFETQTEFLQTYNFDKQTFIHLKERLTNGTFSPKTNIYQGSFSPTPMSDLCQWPLSASTEAMGRRTIEAGEVGAVILNGGMATRFNGSVKGTVEVLPGLSFLSLKLKELAKWSNDFPIFVLNSFATHEKTFEHLQQDNAPSLLNRIHFLLQSISLRLTPTGDHFRSGDALSYYAPGHGEVLEVLSKSKVLSQARQAGLKYLMISNVDNLGATLSPSVLGIHIENNHQVTFEVTNKNPGDRGGSPVRTNKGVEILESFRFPKKFPQNSIPVFNTNTVTLNVDVLENAIPLQWFRVDKMINQQRVVQFEKLLGELTSFVPSKYLIVPRTGNESRFIPVKTPQDLNQIQPYLRSRFSHFLKT